MFKNVENLESTVLRTIYHDRICTVFDSLHKTKSLHSLMSRKRNELLLWPKDPLTLSVSNMPVMSLVISPQLIPCRFLNIPSKIKCSKNGLQSKTDLGQQHCQRVDADAHYKRALSIWVHFIFAGSLISLFIVMSFYSVAKVWSASASIGTRWSRDVRNRTIETGEKISQSKSLTVPSNLS